MAVLEFPRLRTAQDFFVASPQGDAPKKNSGSTWLGLDVQAISKRFQAFTDTVTYSDTFHSLTKFTVSAAAALSPAMVLSKLSRTFAETDTLIDGLRLLSDVRKVFDLTAKDFVAKNCAKICSDVTLLIADFGSAVSLLGVLNIINLENLSSALGRFTVLGAKLPQCLIKVVTGAISLHIQTVAFVFLGIHSVIDIAKDGFNKRNLITLATCIAEVIHKVFMFCCAPLVSVTISVTFYVASSGALGVVANGLGIWHAYDDILGEKTKKA